jgi:alpha-glucosidase
VRFTCLSKSWSITTVRTSAAPTFRDGQHIAGLIQEYEAALPVEGWPNWVLGNHDNHRIASRVGNAQARIAAILLLTLRGTPTLYYGDEIGMHDVDIPQSRVQDPFEKNVPGKGLGRDPERTPMQWDSTQSAGFSNAEPWLPTAEDANVINVDVQRDDPDSMLSLYRRLIALRRGEPALEVGRLDAIEAHAEVLVYARRGRHGEADFLVALNLSSYPTRLRIPELHRGGTVAVSTHVRREGERTNPEIAFGGDEGLVIRLGR